MVAFFDSMGVTFWNPVTCFAACVIIYMLGEWMNRLTKGNVSSLMFASALFLIGFWLHILPSDVTTKPGLVACASNIIVPMLIVNLGTLIDLEDMVREWKTVVVALLGLFGIAAVAFTIGPVLFGREYALMAAPPISGGTIAGVLVQAAANEAGRPELAAFAILVLAFQKFFGMPVITLGMKKDVTEKLNAGYFKQAVVHNDNIKLPQMRIFKDAPKSSKTANFYIGRLAIVATLANLVGLMTKIPGSSPANYYLNPNISYLLFGLLFSRLGFLEKQSLQKSGSYGIGMLGLMMMLPGSLANVTPKGLLEMIVPLVGMLALSTVGICIVAVIVGKVVGYSPWVSCAIACTCMLGYPGTEILTNEICASLECSEEERQRATEYLMPKMIVGGFTTVTLASVAFAGIIAPMIFA